MMRHAKLGTDAGRTGSLRMADLFRLYDWASTPLGKRETWPAVLRTTVDLMLASLHPMCVMWGPERIFLYNDGYARSWERATPAPWASGPRTYGRNCGTTSFP